jgi:hypothetical protein
MVRIATHMTHGSPEKCPSTNRTQTSRCQSGFEGWDTDPIDYMRQQYAKFLTSTLTGIPHGFMLRPFPQES